MGRYDVLLSLHNSKAHKSQLEAWEADIKAFEAHQADNDDELRRLRAEGYQVATMYAVFQGVIFTAVAQTSLLNCALWWSPVALSVSVAAAALLAIADKLYSIGDMKEEMKEMGDHIAALLEIREDVEKRGSRFVRLGDRRTDGDVRKERQRGLPLRVLTLWYLQPSPSSPASPSSSPYFP